MVPTGKRFYESKTFWFAMLTILVGIASAFGFGGFDPTAEQAELINTVIMLVVGVINIVLRFVTSERINWN